MSADAQKPNILLITTDQGLVRFMLYEEGMTSQLLMQFMKRLVKDSQSKVLLILDSLRIHHGKMVQSWLDSNKEKIEVFYLSPYSPEANPDEYLNNDLKRNVHSGDSSKDKASTCAQNPFFYEETSEAARSYALVFPT